MRYKFADIAESSVAKRLPTEEDRLLYIGLEHLESGSLSVSRWGSPVSLKGEKLIMKKGDILFGKRNTYLRRASIAPHDGLFSAHGMILRPKTSVVCEEYFPFFVNSEQFFSKTIQISVGSLSPTVNWKDMRELEFDLPPIEKQRELAELLWAANDLKEKYKKLITASDEMLKAKFREMFGDNEVSENCLHKRIGELAERVTKGTTPTSVGFQFEDQGTIRFVKAENITDDGRFMLGEMSYISSECNEKLARSQLQEGDYLFSIAGVIGRAAIVSREILPANTNQAISIIRLRETDEIDRGFLYAVLRSSYVMDQCVQKQKQTAQANISLEDVRNLRIPLPPLDLQRQFVEIAAQEEKVKANLKKSIADVDNIIKGLING